MSDDDDICENYHGGNEESYQANDFTNKLRDRGLIVDYIKSCGEAGATCDECEKALNLTHQTASARCSELLRDRLIMRKLADGLKVRRLTRHGCWAAVLVLVTDIGTSSFGSRPKLVQTYLWGQECLSGNGNDVLAGR